MRKSLTVLLLACVFTVLGAACAYAYAPGQRAMEVMSNVLNSRRHPLHLVVEQRVDVSELMNPDELAEQNPEQTERIIRTEYNETRGIFQEHVTISDGDGTLLSDVVTFTRGGFWYKIDYLNKTYDRIPEVIGMSVSLSDNLAKWFVAPLSSGIDHDTGYDYDKVLRGEDALVFFFERDTDIWKGYRISYLPYYRVVEVSEEVDLETAFALPPEDFTQKADSEMRSYGGRLMAERRAAMMQNKGKKKKKK